MARARPICKHPESPLNVDAFEAVARFWAENRTGWLRWKGGEARIVEGEPPTGEDLQALVYGLYQDDVPVHLTATVDLPKTGGYLANELWFAALGSVDKSMLKGRGKDNLVPGPAQRWGQKLPLRYATKKLVERVLREEVPLRATLEIPREVRSHVLDEVCALLLMGVLYLQQAARAEAIAPDEQVRLLKETWGRFCVTDDWGLFELKPGDDDAIVESAIARLLGHYQAFEVDPRLAKDGKEAAKRIVKRLHRAAEGIRTGEAIGPVADVPADQGYAEGMRRLKAEVYGEAARCFAKANKAFPGQPRHAAWMAFAIYKDASRPRDGRKKQAVDLCIKAAERDPKGDALYVLGRIAYEEGDHLDCWTQLGRVLRLNPRHRKARRLYDRVSTVLEGSVDVEGDIT